MRAGLVVTGVLGTGTALVFALAALVATLFPNGTLVASSWSGGFGGGFVNGGGFVKGGPVPPIPMPAPGVPGNNFVIQDGVGPTSSDGDLTPQP